MHRLLTILSAYRIAYLISRERGPFDLAERLRTIVHLRFGSESWQAEGIDCPLCISFWAALGLLVAPRWLIRWLGSAGGVLVLHRLLEAFDDAAQSR